MALRFSQVDYRLAKGRQHAFSKTHRCFMGNETMAGTGQMDETDRLISSRKVDGTAVYNRNGDRLGTVDHPDNRQVQRSSRVTEWAAAGL